jgi:crotonobetainyl-CoA:carnitine CoA-transferase CaiB-like acyl-CoA transferase
MDISQTWSRSQPEIKRLAPRLGERSAEILAEYGFSQAEIAALSLSGIVSG